MKEKHTNFHVKTCGTFINQQYAWLHATPDFFCSCDCCGDGCEEVSAPIVWRIQTLKITLTSPTYVWSQKKELEVLKENMHTITSLNSKCSILDTITETSLFVALMNKLLSSVKEFSQISVTGFLLFPN